MCVVLPRNWGGGLCYFYSTFKFRFGYVGNPNILGSIFIPILSRSGRINHIHIESNIKFIIYMYTVLRNHPQNVEWHQLVEVKAGEAGQLPPP